MNNLYNNNININQDNHVSQLEQRVSNISLVNAIVDQKSYQNGSQIDINEGLNNNYKMRDVN